MTRLPFVIAAFACAVALPARSEVILQYFETPWAEVEARLPEVAAAGYDALWLPPPTKGTEGVRDVGFAVYDRFDLGDRNQRGTVATRYGTHAELKSLVAAAHRFGLRVYFDVVMNHHGNPNTIENVGVTEATIGGMADLGGPNRFPSTSVWDFHVLPARVAPNGNCDGSSGCAFCARQPTAAADPDAFGGNQWRVVDEQGQPLGNGGEVCVRNTERRIATLTIEQAMQEPGAPATLPAFFDGYTHLVRAPTMGNFDDFGFEVGNWSLLGLFDLATEQYMNGDGPRAIDGRNAILGTPLPSFIRNNRDAADRESYRFSTPSTPHAEDTREWLIRWIRWLMMDTGADGFRLDAIKHVWPSFYGEDFPGDPIAFNKVIQDTYDELHGFTDDDDDDLVDDAAIFGENFSGSCSALRPYIEGGQRALDFPLFFNIGGRNGMFNGDIGQLSVKAGGGDCAGLGAFGGLNRQSGIGFVQSHDECGAPGGAFTSSNTDPRFSRCEVNGGYRSGATDLSHAFILTREADAAIFYDGNRWTSQSFVRSGRADALGERFAGADQTALVTLVRASKRLRGTQENLWISDNAWAYERDVDGQATGIVVLNDGEGGDANFGNDSNQGSFILTRFAPGTVLRELTGNATYPDNGVLEVLDPAALGAGEQPEVQAARDRFTAVNPGASTAGMGVVYVGVPARSAVIFAPDAVTTGTDSAELLDIPTAALTPGVHALHVRIVNTVAGAADAHDEIVVALCVPDAAGTAICGASIAAQPPANDPLAAGLVDIVVDGADAPRMAIESAPSRSLPDGQAVSRTVVHYAVLDGSSFDLRINTASPAPTIIAARLDDDDLLPGTVITGSPERFLDGFVAVRGEVVGEGEGEGEGENPGEGEGENPGEGEGENPGEGEGENPGEGEGENPGEGEGENPDGDDDADGIRNADDVCPAVADPEQGDFDEDGVGDVCDLCPDVAGDEPSGCPELNPEQLALVRAIALQIALGGAPTDSTDIDDSGVVDVVDLDKAIGAALENR